LSGGSGGGGGGISGGRDRHCRRVGGSVVERRPERRLRSVRAGAGYDRRGRARGIEGRPVPAEGLGKAGIQLRAAWQDVDAHAVGRFQRRQPAGAAAVHQVCCGGRR